MTTAQILIVEDEAIVARDLKMILQNMGYSVPAVAVSGEEAIKKAELFKPDLVLMDIVLQNEMNGIDAAEQIRSRFDIPVIYVTAYADMKTLERAKVTEPFGYIVKPYDEKDLHSAVEIALYKSGMEKKLKESEAWLATTLRSIGDAVIATDMKGNVVFMNPVAQSATGWQEEEAVGRPLTEVFHIINKKTRQLCRNPAEKVLRSGKIIGLANHTVLIARDGIERLIADSGAPIITDKEGTVIGVVIVFRDVTAQRRMEEQLASAEKIESLGILAGGIAHDFNNLLTGIIGNLSLAKKLSVPEEKVYQRLTEAERASMRAKDLTQQLLTFSRGGAPIKRVASLVELIKDTALFSLRGANVRCEFSMPEDLWWCEIDEGQISQTISNLVINADHAMPQGGIINIHAGNVTPGLEDNLPLENKKYVRISIEDNGIGISDEHLSRIFDPYFTTKHAGSGLGLATTYSIIIKHGGLITVDSQVGKGTIFCVYLPASPEQTRIMQDAEKALFVGEGRILIMDDEEIVRDVLATMLRDIGYGVGIAKDGVEAIELYKKAKESGEPFDAVILDITIPGGMGGREAIKRLHEIDPGVKAFVSSGYSNDPIMSAYGKYGFIGVIAKPYNIIELVDALGAVDS